MWLYILTISQADRDNETVINVLLQAYYTFITHVLHDHCIWNIVIDMFDY